MSRIGTRLPGPPCASAAGSSVASSPTSCASVRPGASRPITLSDRIDGRVLGSSVGTVGSQNFVPTSKSNPAGITPTTV